MKHIIASFLLGAASLSYGQTVNSSAATSAQLTTETNARIAADATKADIASPALTGTPTAPTAELGRRSTQIASTEFVQRSVGQPLQFVSRTELHNESSSNGTDTNANVRCEHKASPDFSTGDVQLVYGNWKSDGTATSPSDTGTITLRASLEYPAGTFYPVFFNGSRDAVMQPGAQMVSDTVGIVIPAGATFWTRAYIQVASGQKWPQGFITANNDLGVSSSGSFDKGTTKTDQTTSGTIPGGFTYAFSPIAVIGKAMSSVKQVAVGLVGDSLVQAPNPNSAALGNYHRSAYTEALYGQVPFIQTAKAGNTISTISSNPYLLSATGKYCTHVICNIGVNDFRVGTSLASMQSQLQALWNYFAVRGIKVYQSTITPNTTSTDGWVTTANQTKSAYDSNRTALNDWIRTIPSPLSGYIEIADLSETARNSGIWPANTTQDGLHPVTAVSGGTALLNSWKAAIAAKIPEIKN